MLSMSFYSLKLININYYIKKEFSESAMFKISSTFKLDLTLKYDVTFYTIVRIKIC